MMLCLTDQANLAGQIGSKALGEIMALRFWPGLAVITLATSSNSTLTGLQDNYLQTTISTLS